MPKAVKYTAKLWVEFPVEGEFTLPEGMQLSQEELEEEIYVMSAEGWHNHYGAVGFEVKDIRFLVTEDRKTECQ